MNLSTLWDGTEQVALTRDASRATAGDVERTSARIDMNVGVRATDDRKIEVLAQDLPCFGGEHVTLRNTVGRNGEARPHATEVDRAVLLQARTDKEIRYPELTTWRCRLVVVAIETGGQWSEEAVDLLWQLSWGKGDVPHFMTHQAALVWE